MCTIFSRRLPTLEIGWRQQWTGTAELASRCVALYMDSNYQRPLDRTTRIGQASLSLASELNSCKDSERYLTVFLNVH